MKKNEFEMVLQSYLEEIGVQAEDYNEMMDIEEDDCYIKVPDEIAGYVDATLQYIPSTLSNVKNTYGTYKVIFDKGLGTLQKSAQHPGFLLGNVVNPVTNNGIRDVALLEQISKVPTVVNGVFSAASMATGQYFMSQINSNIRDMRDMIADMQQFLEDDKRSELQAAEEFMNQCRRDYYSIMSNDNQRQATITNIQRIKQEALAGVFFYKKQASQLKNKVNKDKDDKDTVKKNLKRVAQHLSEYWYSLYLYCYAVTMEVAFTKNTDRAYLNNMCGDISQMTEQFTEDSEYWKSFFNNYIDDAKSFKVNKKALALIKGISFIGTSIVLKNEALSDFAVEVVDVVGTKEQEKRNKTREQIKSEFETDVYENCKMDPLLMTINCIKQHDMMYNEPVEFIKTDKGMYIKSSKSDDEKQDL